MTNTRTTIEDYCRKDLEYFRRRLHDLQTNKLKFGNSSDGGRSWIDITSDEIELAKAKIAELEGLIEQS